MITAHLASATAQAAAQALVPTGKGDPTWFDNPALTQKFVPAILETLMMTGLSTLFAVIIGTLLGLLLVQTGKGGLTPNKGVYQAVSFVVNIVRSLPFIIGIIMLIPVTRGDRRQVHGLARDRRAARYPLCAILRATRGDEPPGR